MLEEVIDPRDYSLVSDKVAQLFLCLLKENDNSDNAFDDSFYIAKLLSNLGKLNNFKIMPTIAREVLR